MRVMLFVGTTSDGFIAGKDGEMEVFKQAHSLLSADSIAQMKRSHSEFVDKVDAVVMGRKTFDVVKSMNGPWWYGDKPVFVLGRDPRKFIVPEALNGKIFHIEGSPQEILTKLKAQGFERIYLDGGADVIDQFMEAGLVDEATVTVMPVALASDGLLFMSDKHRSSLNAMCSFSFGAGFVQTRYQVGHYTF